MYSASPRSTNHVEARTHEQLDRVMEQQPDKLTFTVKDDAAMARCLMTYLARCTATHHGWKGVAA